MQTNTLSHQDNITQEKDTLYPRSFLHHNSISSAFVEELASLESMQDNLNYIGEILKSYIAGDYGFNVKITIDGKDIKDELYQRMLKDYRYIKDKKIQQKIQEYVQANKDENLKLILACLAAFLAMLFGAAQAHYQYNNPQEEKDYSKEKGIGKLKRFLPRKSTIAFNGYSIIIAIPFSMITSNKVGEIIIDVGGGLIATLLGGYALSGFGGKGQGKIIAPIFGAGIGAGLWTYRDDIQNFVTWFNDKQIIEIDIESILESLIDSLDTQSFMPQDPFDTAFALIYEILSAQAPKLRELISQEFQILVNDIPQEVITGNLSNEEFQSLIVLLCDERCNMNDIHNFLECSHYLDRAESNNTESKPSDISLHTAPNAIPIHLQAKCLNHNNEPLANKEIYAFSMDIHHFVERAISDDKGIIEFNNILVYDNGSLSQVYFVLKQLGLDEEQKITHIQISPRLDISPVFKKQGSLEGIKTLHFAKDIPKHIEQHDKINAQVRVSAIHKMDTIQTHNATQWAIPLSLKAEYIIKDKTKDTKETQSLIAQYRHNTKWGYMVFDKYQDIHKELQKQGIILSPSQLNTQGECVSVPLRKDWEGKSIAIFAYLKAPSKSVRYDIKHYKAMPLSLCYNGKSLDLLSYGQILKSYKLSQTKNEYMRGHGHIELEQGIDINTTSLDTGTYMMTKTDIQSALILTSNKHRIDTPHLVEEFSPLAFEYMGNKGQRFYISYTANHNNLNLIEYEALQRPINLKSPQIKEHIKIFLESRELFEDLHTIHTTMQNKGLDTLVLEVEGESMKNLRLSGKEWVKEYKEKEGQSEESLLNDLESNFKNNVVTFINVLRNSGASVVVTSTRRSKKRATLMHYAWRIGVSKDITPQQAQIETQKENIPINWIHTDSSGKYSEKISRAKALEMKNAYGMRDKASLTSNHILGKAIDMTITWTKNINIKDKTGKAYTLTPNNGAKCKELQDIGATYGVYKLVKNPPDDPHWSFNGK